ncbi:MAG: hypothetical protein HY429_03010 [Candidatus Levybacteria bacterium]|nr:hypothetical protein [Candidatus Levybacteria bacterium]
MRNFGFPAFGRAGQSIVELLLAMGLSAILLPAILTGLISAKEGKAQQVQKTQAVPLLLEAGEAVRSVREQGWNNFPTNGTYYPKRSGNGWTLATGQETINGFFTREITISDAYRDAGGAIVATPGIADPSTKRIVSRVSWATPFTYSVSSTIFITRNANTSYTETLKTDFDAGTKNRTIVTNISGGEVTLGGGGGSDWCNPNLTITPLDLPKSSAAKAITAVEGEAFVGTGQDSSGESLVDISITNTKPPLASIIETFDGYKTNDVFGEPNYAYIATDTNSKEVIVLDIANTPFTEIGYFNADGSEDGESIFVKGNTGYLIQDDTLWNFDLASKTGARPKLDSNGVELSGDGSSVVVVGNYAYVALSESSRALEIIDVGNPTNMQVVGYGNVDPLNLNSDEVATDVFVNETGSRAYLVIKNTSNLSEFFIIDIATKTGSRPVIGSYDTGAMSPNAVEVVPGGKAIIVGQGGEEYQVVNITNETNPTRCGGLEINTSVFDSASVLEADGDAYAYIVTGDSNAEFKIIEGGPGGQFSTEGTFESQTFDASSSVAFNRFEQIGDEPPNSSISYQIAAADPNPITGTCVGTEFNFIGPDGTPDTAFATNSAIPLNDDGALFENPARCFRYKVFLKTSDTLLSPIFREIHINYSL